MKFKESIKLIAIWILVSFVFGEITIRLFDALTNSNLHEGTSIKDNELGWKSKSNYSIERKNSNDEVIKYSTDNFGFKAFDQHSFKKKSVLFIGDSFTQAVEVSNEDSYYEQLQDSLGFSLFAYGMSGFGTLQEKLIIDEYLKEVNPDLVVLQFCTNDFVDNHYDLNLACIYKINASRPYQKLDGSLFFANPYSNIEKIILKSKFTGFVYNQIKKIRQQYKFTESGESKIALLEKNFKPYHDAITITTDLLKQIKQSLNKDTELILFCADGFEPQLSQIKEICGNENIQFFESHIHRLRESVNKKESPFAKDSVHWNKKGHQIVANSMMSLIKRKLNTTTN